MQYVIYSLGTAAIRDLQEYRWLPDAKLQYRLLTGKQALHSFLIFMSISVG